ncbi:sigma-70 family RNA polymerase sigma factor, partial [Chloroflexota bacterium]
FSAWLYRIAHNQAVDFLRKKNKRAAVPIDESLPSRDAGPQQLAEQRLDIRELVSASRQLTRAQREVIALRFASGLSIAEVARVMGRSEGAVKALQHSAVVSLRKVMV